MVMESKLEVFNMFQIWYPITILILLIFAANHAYLLVLAYIHRLFLVKSFSFFETVKTVNYFLSYRIANASLILEKLIFQNNNEWLQLSFVVSYERLID